MPITQQASDELQNRFVNSPYIGRAQIWDKKSTGHGPHKFFYIGYHDIFGVEMPAVCKRPGMERRKEYQIWGRSWVEGRLSRLDEAIERAVAGDFIDCRHNHSLKVRAKRRGKKFFKKPEWHKTPKKIAVKEEDKLPIRGRRNKKRKRRKLNI